MSGSVTASTANPMPSAGTAARASTGAPRPMSLAIYLHDLSGGGVERQSLIIAEEFRRQGVDVTLVLHRLRGELVRDIPPGLRVVDLNSPRTLQDIVELMRYLRAEKPDVLLSNLDLNNIAALLAKAFAFSRTKVVICQHNPISSSFVACENWLYYFVGAFYRVLMPLISRAVAVSAGVAQELNRMAGIPARRVVTINNPVVGPDFHARCQVEVEHPWFNQPGQPVFVTAGRLVVQKDHETMIRALAIHRRRGNSRLIVLGTGPLREDLDALVTELGLSDAVDFIGFQANALPYLKRADAFVLSSRCEGFGNVLVEALGCGTPVISARCAHGPAEILRDGRYGLLVKPRNAVALAAAMDEVGSLRERFPADLLRQRAADFTYAACASRYLSMFKSLAPHRAWTA